MSKIIKSIFIPEENRNEVVKIPIPDTAELEKATHLTRPLTPKSKEEREKEAADILAQAQEEAATLLREAKEEAEILKEQAKSEGYSQGLARGQEEARMELAEKLTEFQQASESVLFQLEQERKEIISAATEDLLKIILLFAEKIIRTSVSLDPGIMVKILESALEEVDGVARIEIRLHPDDLNIIRQIDATSRFGTSSTEVEFIPDGKLQRFSCVVNTPRLSIDSSIEAQLTELEQVLRKALLEEVNADGS